MRVKSLAVEKLACRKRPAPPECRGRGPGEEAQRASRDQPGGNATDACAFAVLGFQHAGGYNQDPAGKGTWTAVVYSPRRSISWWGLLPVVVTLVQGSRRGFAVLGLAAVEDAEQGGGDDAGAAADM
jgi:hypothetical protein